MAFIAGPYSWKFDTSQLGVTDDAVRVTEMTSADIVTGDNLGDTIQDAINRGGNLLISMVLQEANRAGLDKLFQTHGNATKEWTLLNLNKVGCLLAANAKALVATAINDCTQFQIITFHSVMVAPGFDIQRIFGSRLSNIPIQLLCLPVTTTGGTPPVTTTSQVTFVPRTDPVA